MYTDLYDKISGDKGYFGLGRLFDDHYYTRPLLPPHPGPRMAFDNRDNVMWSINDYLGLTNHQEIRQAALKAVELHGIGAPMGSRMMTGNTLFHLELERELANFSEKEAAFLFNYGYLGVIGTIASLAGQDDYVVMDKLAHACIVDGAFLSGAQVRVFKHNDMNSLEALLKHINRQRKGGILIVCEGVYGMTGDIARLSEMIELKRRYEARLFVDDAHGWGVMGEHGRGVGDYLGVQKGIDIYFGTFAKAFAAIGGFATSEQAVRDWISYNARTQVFAKSLPMIYVKSLRKTLELVIESDERRARMWEVSNRLKQGLRELGYYVGGGASPICTIFMPIGDDTISTVTQRSMQWLRKRGVFVTAVIYPVIPPGLCMFRMIPTAAHRDEDIENTLSVFAEFRNAPRVQIDLPTAEHINLERLFGVSAICANRPPCLVADGPTAK